MSPAEGARGVSGALGLVLAGDEVPGLHPLGDALGRAQVRVTRVDGEREGPEWIDGVDVRRQLRRRWPDDRPFLLVERDRDGAGETRIWADGYGTVRLDAEARELRWAPPSAAPRWLAPRLLFSQGLPLAATLRGIEVLHGGAAVVDGQLVGVVASSGTGKSSTLAHLVAGGAEPFADDVLGMELGEDGRVWAHPGPRQLNLAREQLEAMDERGRARVGVELGESDKVHLEPPPRIVGAPARLGHLVLLERGGPGSAPGTEPAPDLARRLLGNAYLEYVLSPERLVRQLDVASALAHTAVVLRVTVGDGESAAQVAARVRRVVAQRS